jgi:chloramphenicol-sensitive protein RarD
VSETDPRARELRGGVLFGLAAYVLWGVFPVYFKLIDAVAPGEVLLHRIVWAVPFGALIISLRRQWSEVAGAVANPRVLAWLALSALCISGNWFVYIWAVVNERIFETSLGYYINPLMYVLVGVVFFGERLRPAQIAAVGLAASGVLVLTVQAGSLPWVSLALPGLFTAYGVIRKQVAIAAMPGLFAETTLLFPIALGALLWLMIGGGASFPAPDVPTNLLLFLAGPVTVFPLLFFAIAARRLSLTTLGFMQFIAPTLQFMTGIYFGEPLTPGHLVCFACIWSAVLLFSADALRVARSTARRLQQQVDVTRD